MTSDWTSRKRAIRIRTANQRSRKVKFKNRRDDQRTKLAEDQKVQKQIQEQLDQVIVPAEPINEEQETLRWWDNAFVEYARTHGQPPSHEKILLQVANWKIWSLSETKELTPKKLTEHQKWETRKLPKETPQFHRKPKRREGPDQRFGDYRMPKAKW
jgi:hypothetical protein